MINNNAITFFNLNQLTKLNADGKSLFTQICFFCLLLLFTVFSFLLGRLHVPVPGHQWLRAKEHRELWGHGDRRGSLQRVLPHNQHPLLQLPPETALLSRYYYFTYFTNSDISVLRNLVRMTQCTCLPAFVSKEMNLTFTQYDTNLCENIMLSDVRIQLKSFDYTARTLIFILFFSLLRHFFPKSFQLSKGTLSFLVGASSSETRLL